jgi:hypothetical protein
MQMQVGNPKPLEPVRAAVLSQASGLICGPRAASYGPPSENFQRIATGWQVILGANVSPEQVALCMAWLKIARLVNGPHHDSYVDGAGYMALAGELSNADATPIP